MTSNAQQDAAAAAWSRQRWIYLFVMLAVVFMATEALHTLPQLLLLSGVPFVIFGLPSKSLSPRQKRYPLVAVLILTVASQGVYVLHERREERRREREEIEVRERILLQAREKATADESRFRAESPRDHLDEARKLLKVDASTEAVRLAERHLAAAGDANSHEASSIRSEYKSAQEKVDAQHAKAAQAYAAAEEARKDELQEAARVVFAHTTENKMLSQGYDMHISAIGPYHRILRIEWVLMNRPAIYQLVHTPDLADSLRSDGFTSILVTDGFEHTWKLNVPE